MLISVVDTYVVVGDCWLVRLQCLMHEYNVEISLCLFNWILGNVKEGRLKGELTSYHNKYTKVIADLHHSYRV